MAKYYSTERPISIGTYPKYKSNKVLNIENFDMKTQVMAVSEFGPVITEAWGIIEYENKIPEQAAKQYELVEVFEYGD